MGTCCGRPAPIRNTPHIHLPSKMFQFASGSQGKPSNNEAIVLLQKCEKLVRNQREWYPEQFNGAVWHTSWKHIRCYLDVTFTALWKALNIKCYKLKEVMLKYKKRDSWSQYTDICLRLWSINQFVCVLCHHTTEYRAWWVPAARRPRLRAWQR